MRIATLASSLWVIHTIPNQIVPPMTAAIDPNTNARVRSGVRRRFRSDSSALGNPSNPWYATGGNGRWAHAVVNDGFVPSGHGPSAVGFPASRASRRRTPHHPPLRMPLGHRARAGWPLARGRLRPGRRYVRSVDAAADRWHAKTRDDDRGPRRPQSALEAGRWAPRGGGQRRHRATSALRPPARWTADADVRRSRGQ